MSQLLHLSSAPHDRGSLSTKTVMRDVLVALLPTAVLGVWAHGWYAGFIMLVSIAAAVVIAMELLRKLKSGAKEAVCHEGGA